MASRKNFPGRIEARRLRASERNNPTLVAAIPLPAQPVPTPDASDGTPVAPTLAQFGLSDDALKQLPKLWFRNSMQSGAREVWTYLFMHTATFLLLFHNSVRVSLPTLIGFVGFFFVFLFPFLFFWAAMGWVERQLYIHFNQDFARYSQYQNAVVVFERLKREHEARLAKRRVEYWLSLSGVGFERELGKLFSLMGYTVAHTPMTADGGVDLILRKDENLTVVQCKAHNKKISISVARELVASMMDFQADDAIIACIEGVTKPVADYISTKRITVMTLNDIIANQMKHG